MTPAPHTTSIAEETEEQEGTYFWWKCRWNGELTVTTMWIKLKLASVAGTQLATRDFGIELLLDLLFSLLCPKGEKKV